MRAIVNSEEAYFWGPVCTVGSRPGRVTHVLTVSTCSPTQILKTLLR